MELILLSLIFGLAAALAIVHTRHENALRHYDVRLSQLHRSLTTYSREYHRGMLAQHVNRYHTDRTPDGD